MPEPASPNSALDSPAAAAQGDVATEQAPAEQMTDKQAGDKQPAAPSSPPSPPVDPATLALQVEALLMTTDKPLPGARLAELLGQAGVKWINQAIASLNEVYQQTGRSFRAEQVAGGWQILTLPEHASVLAALHKTRSSNKLGAAAMETLAIVAYKQPILRAQIEAIRGVACGEVLRTLMERRLVKIVGRAEEIGRPMLYGTTKAFLEVFGLSHIKDLPKVEELKLKGEPV